MESDLPKTGFVFLDQRKFCGQPCKNRHFNALKKIAWQKFKAEGVGVGQG